MAAGAALRASAISAPGAMRYWSIGAMLGYRAVASRACACTAATTTKLAIASAGTVVRFIAFLLRCRALWCRSVRPRRYRNNEFGDRLRRILMHVHRGAGDGAPQHVVGFGNPEHQVGLRMPVLAAEVLLLRHHVAHRTRLRQREFFFIVRDFDTVDHLRSGQSSQRQRCRFESEWQMGSCRRVIEADLNTLIGIQFSRVVDRGHPLSLHQADPAVRAFDSGFVSMPSQNQGL